MKLILFGLGPGLDIVEEKIRDDHVIVGYTDSYAKIKKYKGKEFFDLKSIYKLDFDYLIITILNSETAWNVQNMLLNQYKIPSEKIIPFYIYAKRELWDAKMKSNKLEDIKGLIFGNSNAAYGFLEKELSIPFINLAVPSQDIYYNWCVFDKCIKKYGNKLTDLEYIVIDLYDYVEFNLDCSLSLRVLNYLYYGGIYEEHNFSENKNFENSLSEEMFNKYKIYLKNDFQTIMKELFVDWNLFDLLGEENRWKHIECDEPLDVKLLESSIVENRFESTIKENKEILKRFLEEIRKFNPKMKIIFTLIPRYITMEKVTEIVLSSWKKEFFDEITALCKNYKVFLLNYKQKKEISENHLFYWDIQHMNTIGGRALSAILNEDLYRLEE